MARSMREEVRQLREMDDGARGNSAKRELSKTEFKDEVERLGLTVKGQPATRKQLGALFDTVDKDGSGCVRLTRSSHCPIPCTGSYVRYC